MKTLFVRKEDVERNWLIIDGTNHRVGRLATTLATLLRGKHKANFTPNVDNGDFVVLINADKLEMTGNKWEEKKYYRHSRFFGSLKEKSAAQMKEEKPEFIIREAVRGMLPKNKLSYSLIDKLKIYSGSEHPHAAQRPVNYNLTNLCNKI